MGVSLNRSPSWKKRAREREKGLCVRMDLRQKHAALGLQNCWLWLICDCFGYNSALGFPTTCDKNFTGRIWASDHPLTSAGTLTNLTSKPVVGEWLIQILCSGRTANNVWRWTCVGVYQLGQQDMLYSNRQTLMQVHLRKHLFIDETIFLGHSRQFRNSIICKICSIIKRWSPIWRF